MRVCQFRHIRTFDGGNSILGDYAPFSQIPEGAIAPNTASAQFVT